MDHTPPGKHDRRGAPWSGGADIGWDQTRSSKGLSEKPVCFWSVAGNPATSCPGSRREGACHCECIPQVQSKSPRMDKVRFSINAHGHRTWVQQRAWVWMGFHSQLLDPWVNALLPSKGGKWGSLHTSLETVALTWPELRQATSMLHWVFWGNVFREWLLPHQLRGNRWPPAHHELYRPLHVANSTPVTPPTSPPSSPRAQKSSGTSETSVIREEVSSRSRCSLVTGSRLSM